MLSRFRVRPSSSWNNGIPTIMIINTYTRYTLWFDNNNKKNNNWTWPLVQFPLSPHALTQPSLHRITRDDVAAPWSNRQQVFGFQFVCIYYNIMCYTLIIVITFNYTDSVGVNDYLYNFLQSGEGPAPRYR